MKNSTKLECLFVVAETCSIEVYDRLVTMHESIKKYDGIWSVKETMRRLEKHIEELEQCLNTMKTEQSK